MNQKIPKNIMRSQIFKILEDIQKNKLLLRHRALEKVFSIFIFIKNSPQDAIQIVWEVYFILGKYSMDKVKGSKEVVDLLLSTYQMILQCVNNNLNEVDEQLMSQNILEIVDYQGAVYFNEKMIEFCVQLSQTPGIKNKIIGLRMILITIQNIDLKNNYLKYSHQIIKLLLILAINLIKDKIVSWKSYGLKLTKHLQSIQSEQNSRYQQCLKFFFLSTITSDPNINLRLQTLQSLKITPYNLPVIVLLITDSNFKVCLSLLQKLCFEKIPLYMFDLCTFYKLLFYCVQTQEQNIAKQFINYIKCLFESQDSTNKKDNFAVFQKFLQFMQPTVFLYYPKIQKNLCVFLKCFVNESKKSRLLFQNYAIQLCQNIVNNQILTDQVFYVRIIIQFQIQIQAKLFDRYFLASWAVSTIKKCFQNHQLFQVSQILEILKLTKNILEFARNEIINALLEILLVEDYFICQIPQSRMIYRNQVCPNISSNEFQQMRFTQNIFSKPIFNTANKMMQKIIQVLFELLSKQPNHYHIQNVIIKLMSRWDQIQNAGKNDMKSRCNEKNRSELTNQLVEKIGIIALSMYNLVKETDIKLYRNVKGIVKNNNKYLWAMINSKFIINFYNSSHKLQIEQISQFCEDYIQIKDNDAVLRTVYMKQFTKLNVSIQILRKSPTISNYQQAYFIYTETILDYLFCPILDTRSLGIESLCSILYFLKIPSYELYFACLIISSLNSNLKIQDSQKIRKLIESKLQNQNLFLVFYSAHLILKLLAQKDAQFKEGSVSTQQTKSQLLLGRFIKDSLQFLYFMSEKNGIDSINTFHQYLVIVHQTETYGQNHEQTQKYFQKYSVYNTTNSRKFSAFFKKVIQMKIKQEPITENADVNNLSGKNQICKNRFKRCHEVEELYFDYKLQIKRAQEIAEQAITKIVQRNILIFQPELENINKCQKKRKNRHRDRMKKKQQYYKVDRLSDAEMSSESKQRGMFQRKRINKQPRYYAAN